MKGWWMITARGSSKPGFTHAQETERLLPEKRSPSNHLSSLRGSGSGGDFSGPGATHVVARTSQSPRESGRGHVTHSGQQREQRRQPWLADGGRGRRCGTRGPRSAPARRPRRPGVSNHPSEIQTEVAQHTQGWVTERHQNETPERFVVLSRRDLRFHLLPLESQLVPNGTIIQRDKLTTNRS